MYNIYMLFFFYSFIPILSLFLSPYSFSYSLSSFSFLDLPSPLSSSSLLFSLLSLPLYRDADIESQDTDLYTPLLTAAAYGQMEAMKALIKANALIDVVDRTRKTLVFIAAEEDQVHILEVMNILD